MLGFNLCKKLSKHTSKEYKLIETMPNGIFSTWLKKEESKNKLNKLKQVLHSTIDYNLKVSVNTSEDSIVIHFNDITYYTLRFSNLSVIQIAMDNKINFECTFLTKTNIKNLFNLIEKEFEKEFEWLKTNFDLYFSPLKKIDK